MYPGQTATYKDTKYYHYTCCPSTTSALTGEYCGDYKAPPPAWVIALIVILCVGIPLCIIGLMIYCAFKRIYFFRDGYRDVYQQTPPGCCGRGGCCYRNPQGCGKSCDLPFGYKRPEGIGFQKVNGVLPPANSDPERGGVVIANDNYYGDGRSGGGDVAWGGGYGDGGSGGGGGQGKILAV